MHRRVAPVHFWNDVDHLFLGMFVSIVRVLLANARRREQNFISLLLPLP
jgi:hypothetical protein